MGEFCVPNSCLDRPDEEGGCVPTTLVPVERALVLAREGGRAALERAAETEAEGARMLAFLDLGFLGVLEQQKVIGSR